jgi:Dolichyl-phosphate-mannose-protein mannosyltransferase
MTAGERPTKQGPLIVVLVAGMVVGFFIWKTYVGYVPHYYPLDFKQGQWLVASDEGPQGYFRKELYIPGAIKQAWIMVAATDSFFLYINGKTVHTADYGSVNVSGIYDIGSYLHFGKNVLGISARRDSYPGPAMAAIEGAYLDQIGREHPFATDASWKFSPLEQSQAEGEIPWHSELFDATSWTNARAAGRPQPSEVYPLSVHPLAFTMPPHGSWIRHADSWQDQAAFTYTLMLPTRAEDAWLRVASAHPYSLVVNGMTVEGEAPSAQFLSTSASRDLLTLKLANLLTAKLIGSYGINTGRHNEGVSTDLYQIAPLLRTGVNRIIISSGPWSPALPGLFVDGFVMSRGELRTFGTNSGWTVAPVGRMTNGQDAEQVNAITLPESGPLPVKQVLTTLLPLAYTARQTGVLTVVLSLTVGLIFLFWKATSRILYILEWVDQNEARSLDALAHLPILLVLSALFLLSFDVRVDPTFPFQGRIVWLSTAVLLVFKATLMLEALYCKTWGRQASCSAVASHRPTARYVCAVLLLALVVVGAFLRLHNLDTQSLYHDEVHMLAFVKGLFEKGYPYKMIGPVEIPLATYELVPYPIALSAKLLGFNDFTLRLPAALFGIMTILLIYIIGQQVFDRRVGLLAAAVYTFCPQALIWAKYLWHPQQTQFFALLTSYLFYRAIRPVPMSPAYLYLTAFSFILTYLSWEGAGFLLPALGIGLLVVRRKEFTWLREKHLWIAVGLVGLAVVVQLSRRLLILLPYLVVGTGLSDVSLPTFYFLDPMYDPTFYLMNFLWLENNVLLTLFLLGGLPFFCKQTGFSYYCTLLFAVLFMMANTLSHAAIRYAYYLQPFLILPASAMALYTLDCCIGIVQSSRSRTISLLKGSVTVTLFAMVVLGSSFFMKLYRLTDFSNPSGVHTREDAYYIDYRTSAQYLKSRYQDGDLVIAVVPDSLTYYSNIECHYYAQDYTIRQVFYDPSEFSPMYLEKIAGKPTLTDINELREALSNHRRTWIVAAPHNIFTLLLGSEMTELINKWGKVVYESYNAKIYLLQS